MEKNILNISLLSEKGTGLPTAYLLKHLTCFSKDPVVTNTLKIWSPFIKQNGLLTPSGLTPIYHNHRFLPSCSDPAFLTWSERGLKSINDIYIDGVFPTFLELAAKFNLPNSHWFQFLPIRHFVQKHFPFFPNRPPDSSIDSFLSDLKRLISLIYNYS